MEAASTSEMPVNFYHTTHSNIPEDSNLLKYFCCFFFFAEEFLKTKTSVTGLCICSSKTTEIQLLFDMIEKSVKQRSASVALS
jgi:hypothetical protein